MFKNFHGFHLLEAYQHRKHHEKRNRPGRVLKKTVEAIVVVLVTLLLWNLPSDSFGIDGLNIVQQRIIAIFAFATLMWVLEVVPSWATSVAIMGLMLLFCSDSGVKWLCDPDEVGALLSYKGVMACFADPVIMLFIGGFILAIAATKTGLDAQLAKVLLKPFGTRSEMVLLGFLLITGLFSMFVSNTATAAMMLTFLTPVFKQLPPEGKGRIALALSIPVAANLGGMGTPIGTPPNTIALKYLNDPEGLNLNLGFGEWMMFMVPLVAVLLFIGWMLLKTMFPFTQKRIELTIEGGMKPGIHSKIVIVTFIATVALWLLDSVTGINSYTVALIPFVVFAMTGVISRQDLEEINWSVIWMVAGGFALGYGLNQSGLAELAAPAHPHPLRRHLLPPVELHQQLGHGGAAHAHPRGGLLGNGRQARRHRRHLDRAHRCGHRLLVGHDPAHLHAAQRAGIRHQPGAAEGHGPHRHHHRHRLHGARLLPALCHGNHARHLNNELTHL